MYPHVADGVLRMVVVLVVREEDPVVLGSIGDDSGALGLHFAVFASPIASGWRSFCAGQGRAGRRGVVVGSAAGMGRVRVNLGPKCGE